MIDPNILKRGAPVALSSTVNTVSGAAVKMQLALMQQHSMTAIAVDEFLFECVSPPLVAYLGPSLRDTRGQIRLRIQAGPYTLTNGFVPVWNFAPNQQDMLEAPLGAISQAVAYTRWKLPTTMFLPPGYVINITVYRDPAVDTFMNTGGGWPSSSPGIFTCTILGRVLPASVAIKEADIPYVSCATFDDHLLFSGEQDLKNTLDKTIRIQRFIGRIQTCVADPFGFRPIVTDGYMFHTNANYPIRSLRDSKGYNIVDHTTPWWGMFPPERRAWTFNRNLPIGEQFIMGLGQTPTIASQPMISFVGTRTERV